MNCVEDSVELVGDKIVQYLFILNTRHRMGEFLYLTNQKLNFMFLSGILNGWKLTMLSKSYCLWFSNLSSASAVSTDRKNLAFLDSNQCPNEQYMQILCVPAVSDMYENLPALHHLRTLRLGWYVNSSIYLTIWQSKIHRAASVCCVTNCTVCCT